MPTATLTRMKRKAIREAYGILAILGIAAVAGFVFFPPLSVMFFVMILFTVYFFRDPVRIAPDDPELAVAPADGRVVGIETRIESEVLIRRMKCVSIFLSVFDVHVNRSPIAGTVTASQPKKGRFLDARDPDSARLNASRTWVIESGSLRVAVKQITGAIARRIVPWSEVGDELAQGSKFGMIRFGSRTELYLPENAEILVKVGQSVRGGVTPIARFPNTAQLTDTPSGPPDNAPL